MGVYLSDYTFRASKPCVCDGCGLTWPSGTAIRRMSYIDDKDQLSASYHCPVCLVAIGRWSPESRIAIGHSSRRARIVDPAGWEAARVFVGLESPA